MEELWPLPIGIWFDNGYLSQVDISVSLWMAKFSDIRKTKCWGEGSWWCVYNILKYDKVWYKNVQLCFKDWTLISVPALNQFFRTMRPPECVEHLTRKAIQEDLGKVFWCMPCLGRTLLNICTQSHFKAWKKHSVYSVKMHAMSTFPSWYATHHSPDHSSSCRTISPLHMRCYFTARKRRIITGTVDMLFCLKSYLSIPALALHSIGKQSQLGIPKKKERK